MLMEIAMAAELCRVTPACSIRGDFKELKQKVYILTCGKEGDGQIELRGEKAELFDPITREKKATCQAEKNIIAKAIRAYAKSQLPPKCRLEKQAGQMRYVTPNSQGRCSFRMNKNAYAEFTRKTKKNPFYQCENDHFLITHENADAEIFQGATLECRAHLHTSSADAAKDPENYYQPPEPTFIP